MALFKRTKKEAATPVATPKPLIKGEKPVVDETTKNAYKSELILRVLRAPYITEKAVARTAQGHYVFEVATDANKVTIAQAIQARYGVKPAKVNIVKMKGKLVSSRGSRGVRKNWKKAYIMLRKGDTIATEAASEKKEQAS
ncbi:MAG: 50S ribosomal protein L23 [bacterium]|nr:50S ribosomal protein L23 [bacterium]